MSVAKRNTSLVIAWITTLDCLYTVLTTPDCLYTVSDLQPNPVLLVIDDMYLVVIYQLRGASLQQQIYHLGEIFVNFV